LASLINGFENFEVVTEALNGKDILEDRLNESTTKDLLLIDVQMPVMDWYLLLRKSPRKYPAIKWLPISTEDDGTIINMIKEPAAVLIC